MLSVVLLLLGALLGGCGKDDTAREATPAEDSATFVEGNFGSIPIHPLSDPVGQRSTKDGATAQSFEARNVSIEGLFTWYDEHLTGWADESPPAPVGEAADSAWRARWIRDDQRLIVSATTAPTLGDDDRTPTIQYSLSLQPASRPVPTP